jgi:hypothetical protein
MVSKLFWIAAGMAALVPFLVIAGLVANYFMRRFAWKRNQRLGRKNPGFCPSSSSMGTALQCLQVFYRPSIAFVVEAKEEEDAAEDDEGDPESRSKRLNRQLKRIRRGEPIDRLEVRL